jgi:hypothetical protein
MIILQIPQWGWDDGVLAFDAEFLRFALFYFMTHLYIIIFSVGFGIMMGSLRSGIDGSERLPRRNYQKHYSLRLDLYEADCLEVSSAKNQRRGQTREKASERSRLQDMEDMILTYDICTITLLNYHL